MTDKRKFHCFLNGIKDTHQDFFELIESIQEEFENKTKAITDREKKALKQYPIQFVKRIPQEKSEWTSQLHIWGEQCVPEILNLEPIYLAFKNSVGDSVLMSLVLGSTGAYTEKVNYDLIKKILNTDLSYENIETDKEGNETININNVLDELDLNEKTVIDYLVDFAFGIGQFAGGMQDERLQNILREFSKIRQQQKEEEEKKEKEIEDEAKKARETAEKAAKEKERQMADDKDKEIRKEGDGGGEEEFKVDD